MRARKPLVFGSETVPATIRAEAQRIGADLRLAGRDFGHARAAGDPPTWSWHGRETVLQGLALPSLFGRVQLANAAAVLAVLEALGVTDVLDAATIDRAFSGLTLPGRFQRVERDGRRYLLDVAHNPGAARVLSDLLSELAHPGPVTAIIGVLADKDAGAIVRRLAPHVDRWIAVRPASARAADPAALAALIANECNRPCLVMPAPAAALDHVAAHATADTLVLVTGSFYTVGPALEWLL